MRISPINPQMNTNRMNQNASASRNNSAISNQHSNVNFGTHFSSDLQRIIVEGDAHIRKVLGWYDVKTSLEDLCRRIAQDGRDDRYLGIYDEKRCFNITISSSKLEAQTGKEKLYCTGAVHDLLREGPEELDKREDQLIEMYSLKARRQRQKDQVIAKAKTRRDSLLDAMKS